MTTVLVVEDEVLVAEDLRLILEGGGYSVSAVVRTGSAAIAAARAKRPDLTLLDIQLKGPIDGIEVAEVFLAERLGAVIFLTSHTDTSTLARGRRAMAASWLEKPFADDDLLALVEAVLTGQVTPMGGRPS